MRVIVDEDRCAGHGMCLTLCPQVFELNDDGWAVAEASEIPADLKGPVKDAIANCPEHAIVEIET